MDESKKKNISNTEIKSSAFTAFFSEPENAAQLFSALDGQEVSPEDITYTTLEGVLFVARKNDMAFTVKNKVLVISEHQSTINYNMPLRSIIYYGRTMEQLIPKRYLYREKRIPIPTPEFYVFYNGNAPFPAEDIMRLSDAYLEKTDTPMLELNVKVININIPVNHTLLKKCRPLYEYSWFIQKIKEYMAVEKNLDKALTQTIEDCEREGIMVDFVRKHGSEAVNMLFTQWNMEDALEVRYEEGFEDGFEDGELFALVKLVNRKYQKGKDTSAIAVELEVPLETVEKICEAIRETHTEDTKIICKYLKDMS
ncbi:MAG: hypothetical protein IKJ39_02495 [Lachnospiraceae bacterium]|nr:hypothetical protein [Lachnospiraceae bacterium]